ncbi:hypothetical protein FRB90_012151 [Tulasnella sp. 427]|nr:hypothetical protein FRB90_012151 [Tulasnella sp. 427]
MADEFSNLDTLCRTLEPGAQSHFLRTHVADFIEDAVLDDFDRKYLQSGYKKTRARWSKYPKMDHAQRKLEITELLLNLSKASKYCLPSDMEEANNIMLEIVRAVLDWTKVLWTVGVEFGEQPELVHDALSFLVNTLPEVVASTASCTCIIPSIKVVHTFLRTDGHVAEEIRGPADRVIKTALIVVWREMLLAQLNRMENQEDTSPFVKNLLPSIMEEICSLGNMGISGLLSIVERDAIDDTDGFESEDEYESYLGHTTDEDEDSDDSDEMPPLMTIGPLTPPAASKPTVEDIEVSEDDNDSLPGLATVSHSSVSDAESEPKDVPNAEPKEEDVKKDGEVGEESITWDLDEEDGERTDQEPRLERLVVDFVVKYIKLHPGKDAFGVLISSPVVARRRSNLRTILLNHYLAMPHTPLTFSVVISIFIKEKATSHLTKLLAANPSMHPRAAGNVQDAASYLIGLTGVAHRKQGAKIILESMETMIQDMVMEVEFAFRGVRREVKRAEIMTILRTLKDDERKAAIKIWVDEVITPPPEALSKDVMPQPPVPNFDNPMAALAAAMTAFSSPAGNYNDPLGYDMIEMLDFNSTGLDAKMFVQRFRPDFSFLFESWKAVLNQVVKKAPKECGRIRASLCKSLQAMAPYLQSTLVTREMMSRLDTERQAYLRTIINLINRFMLDEVKKATDARKAQAATKQPAESNPVSSSPTIVSTSTPPSSAAASNTSPSLPTSTTPGPNFQMPSTPGGLVASLFPNLVPHPPAADDVDEEDVPQEYIDAIMNGPLGALFMTIGAISGPDFNGDGQESGNPVEEEAQTWDSVD